MFILKIYDRKGKELKIGDTVKVSDRKDFKFYAEVKYLEKEKVLTPFHTFSFHSFEKVDGIPEGATKSTEERYGIWYFPDPEKDESAQDFETYLMEWRACEHNIGKGFFKIELKK